MPLPPLRAEPVLGSGAYAVVYAHSDDVAVKVTMRDVVPFAREVAALRQCKHAYIPQLVGCGMADGERPSRWAKEESPYAWLALPRAQTTMYRYLRRRSRPPPALQATLRLAQHVAEALQYLHAHRMVHRDVKSDNVLLVCQGAHMRALLSDLGMCRSVDGEHNPIDGSAAYSRHVVTRMYRSPELQLGFDYADMPYAIDVWAFGVLCYEAVAAAQGVPSVELHVVGIDKSNVAANMWSARRLDRRTHEQKRSDACRQGSMLANMARLGLLHGEMRAPLAEQAGEKRQVELQALYGLAVTSCSPPPTRFAQQLRVRLPAAPDNVLALIHGCMRTWAQHRMGGDAIVQALVGMTGALPADAHRGDRPLSVASLLGAEDSAALPECSTDAQLEAAEDELIAKVLRHARPTIDC